MNNAVMLVIDVTALIEDDFRIGVGGDKLRCEYGANGIRHGNRVADESVKVGSSYCGFPVSGPEESLFANADMLLVDMRSRGEPEERKGVHFLRHSRTHCGA